MKRSIRTLLAIGLACAPAAPATAQGVVVDQGRFVLRTNGQEVGSEEFVIRRAGLGSGDALFASAVVSRTVDGAQQEMRPLLRVAPLDGMAESYQITVTGRDAADIRLIRSGRRYVATIRSTAGDEDREFQARPETRVVELDVAHQYYFLRALREGRDSSVLEPRSGGQLTITAGPSTNVEIRLGPNVVSARRVTFTTEKGDERTVWYDRQGRVLRVEVPSRGYVAERTDLVG